MRLIAEKEFYYGGRNLKVGEAFDAASDEDARMFKGFGQAKDAPHKPASVKTRALKSGDADEGDANRGRPGRYSRADMRAED